MKVVIQPMVELTEIEAGETRVLLGTKENIKRCNMAYELFPPIFSQRQDSLIKGRIQDAEQEIKDKYRSKLRKCAKRCDADTHRKSSVAFWRVIAVIAGIIFGWYFAGLYAPESEMAILNQVFGGLAGILAGVIAGWIVGSLLFFLFYPITMRKINKEKEKIDAMRRRMGQEYDAMKKRIRGEVESEKARYTAAFEQTAAKMSTGFKNSERIKEIITQVATTFIERISALDKSAHVAQLNASLTFKVFPHCISIDDELDYDFETNRCAELNDAITQAALAKLLAAQVRATVQNYFAQCSAGGAVTAECKYADKKDFTHARHGDEKTLYPAIVCLQYSARNANYRAVQGW
jgi:hypothetical protein